MSSISLRQLRYAQVIAEEGHFGRAAQRCHVTQPALSQQIRALEERCGAPLFDRLGKSVRPTPFGRAFLARAATVLSAADDLETFADMSAGLPSRPIAFGMIPTVAPYLLPDMLPALARSFPELSFGVSEGKTEKLVAALIEGELDLALIATDPGNPALRTLELFADPFVLATAKASPNDTALPDPVDIADLPRDRILLLEEGHCLRDQAVDACALKPDLMGRTFAATSLTTIIELVANGYGVTLLPAISLKREEHDTRIALHTLASPGAGRTLRLAWRQGSPHADLFVRIADVVTAVGQNILATDIAV